MSEDINKLLGVLGLSNSSFLSRLDVDLIEAPKIYKNDCVRPEVAKHLSENAKSSVEKRVIKKTPF